MQIYKDFMWDNQILVVELFMIKKGKIKFKRKLKLHLIAIRFLCYFKDYCKET